jgi:hypothetical protein
MRDFGFTAETPRMLRKHRKHPVRPSPLISRVLEVRPRAAAAGFLFTAQTPRQRRENNSRVPPRFLRALCVSAVKTSLAREARP